MAVARESYNPVFGPLTPQSPAFLVVALVVVDVNAPDDVVDLKTQ